MLILPLVSVVNSPYMETYRQIQRRLQIYHRCSTGQTMKNCEQSTFSHLDRERRGPCTLGVARIRRLLKECSLDCSFCTCVLIFVIPCSLGCHFASYLKTKKSSLFPLSFQSYCKLRNISKLEGTNCPDSPSPFLPSLVSHAVT